MHVRQISSEAVAFVISHELKRQQRSRNWLSRQLGVDAMWVSRRLNGMQLFKVDELQPIASALGLTAAEIFELNPCCVSGLEVTKDSEETYVD